MTSGRRSLRLEGRQRECATLDRLVADLGAGHSAALVLRGESGIGKTALLDHVEATATGCRVVRVSGVESEMELAFAGLHQLCAQVPGLVARGRDGVLGTAFGLTSGPPPERFQVGLAMLNLLAEAAADQPLVCLVDDAQWLDQVSAQTLAFVARRLVAERVALVFAVCEPSAVNDLAGLPELVVEGLGYGDSRALLDSTIGGVVDESIRDTFVVETRGNPLALVELHRGLSAGELASGFGLPGTGELTSTLEQGFVRRVHSLPPDAQLVLLAAAAEPVGDPTLLFRATTALGIGSNAVTYAEAADLVDIGARVRFRHSLIRSAVYRSATPQDRRRVHEALAAVVDTSRDPDRRAWHRAAATVGLDEDVAAELQSAAGRAKARGGIAAAAACLERAAELTPDPVLRSERALAAAGAKFRAGDPEAALDLLVTAAIAPADDLTVAYIERLRAQIAFARQRGGDAGALLLEAANRLATLEGGPTREAYLEALGAAVYGGRLGGPGTVEKVAAAARSATRAAAAPHGPMDLLLDAVATQFTDGFAVAVPSLRHALHDFRDAARRGEEQVVQWLWRGCPVAVELWDDEAWYELACRGVELARGLGALGVLPGALAYRAAVHVHSGEFAAAGLLVAEADAIAAATASAPLREARFMLDAWRGDEATALESLDRGSRDALARGEGRALSLADHSTAVLYNGLRNYDKALAAAQRACEQEDLGIFGWSLPECIEAAVRSGAQEPAADALARLADRTRAAGTDWALGILARSAALLAEGDRADALYREAIDRLGRTRMAVHLARSRLLYGEWLRRTNRRQDAREQLRIAYDSLTGIGAAAFAERARQELRAAGDSRHTRTPGEADVLTAQEAQIAQLAAEGLTNAEIAAELFLSPHTVDWHLRKVFSKLGITSRRHLARATGRSPARPARSPG